MPLSRAPSGSTASGSSSNAFKRTLPFKPPGPAKKAAASSSRRTSAPPKKTATKPKSRTKDTGPEVLIPSSSSESSGEEDFGTTIDLDMELDAEVVEDGDGDGGIRDKGPNPTTTDLTKTQPDTVQTPPPTTDSDEIPGLPPALLTRLIHENTLDKTALKISKPANELMRTYVDVFVREAVARAAEGRKERERERGGTGTRGTDVAIEDLWLDVEDLERVVPGLLLDF